MNRSRGVAFMTMENQSPRLGYRYRYPTKPMRFSLKTSLGLVALAAIACLIGTWILRLTASDFWGYGKLRCRGRSNDLPCLLH